MYVSGHSIYELSLSLKMFKRLFERIILPIMNFEEDNYKNEMMKKLSLAFTY